MALLAPTQHVEANVSMLKWKLMITTLPVPVAAILVRLVLEHFFKNYMNNYSGVMDFSALAPVLTGGVFLIGLMLSGTLQDYKESEKIPAELATCLESIEETVSWVSANRPAVNDRAMKEVVAEVTDEMVAWLFRKRTPEQGFAAIEKLNSLVKDFDKLNAGLPAVRMMTEIHNLRRTMTRIGVISRTGFLASGYALLDLLVVSVLTLLVIASYKAEFGLLGKYIIIGFVSLIYSYLWRLVRDVDDPFEYAPTGERTGAAEVELFPLLEYQARARERLAGKSIEERIAAGAAKAEPEAEGPSVALLAGVGVGCLCAGALVVYVLSRTMEKPAEPLPGTAAPNNITAPAGAKADAGPAVEDSQKAATKPAADAATKAEDSGKDSGKDSAKSEAAEKSGTVEDAAEEESAKKSKRRHHRRKKE